jgi:hypothetical protein
LKPEKYRIDMRALDQFRKLFATIADGIATARQSSYGRDGDRDRNEQRNLPPGDKRVETTRQVARDGDNRAQPLSGSYPAVWPH